MIYCPGGGTVHPNHPGTGTKRTNYLRMAGNETFKHAVIKMSDVCMEALESNGVTVDDIDLFIPHQANMRIIKSVGKRLGFPEKKVFVNLERFGNTSAASIPIALAEAWETGRCGKGDLVLLVAFGAGLTWGSALLRM